MITINPKAQSIANAAKLKKLSKKDNDKRAKFSSSKKTQENSSSEAASGVADIGGMLFLQEVDQYAEDQQNLEEFSKKAFKILKNLQMDLLEGNISGRRLHNLKDAITSNKFIISNPEMANVAEDIKLRIEVEVTKLEMNQK